MQIPLAKQRINFDELGDHLEQIFKSGWWTMGGVTAELEQKFAEYKKVKHAIAVSSCSAALHIATRILFNQQKNKIVITTPLTFCSTVNSIIHSGGTPLFIDVDKKTKCIDLSNEDFRYIQGIIVVHFAGYPCDMSWIDKARKEGIWIIEDCAHATEGIWNDKNTGTIGDIGCFDPRVKVDVKNGRKRIMDIKVGDYVLTHKNNYKKVTKIFKRKYSGPWYQLKLKGIYSKSSHIRATEEHPILINRNGDTKWELIKNIKKTDWVYIKSSKCEICGKTIPYFWRLCEHCNPAQLDEVRDKISKVKRNGLPRPKHFKTKFKHFYDDILPYTKELEKKGYRIIPIGVAIPDIIAIKDNKVYAYEIENAVGTSRKESKYTEEFKKYYDDIFWIYKNKKRTKRKGKTNYKTNDKLNLVCLPIDFIKKESFREKTVYNLEVKDDHSYFVAGIAVHNCFSFNPTKNLAAPEMGMLITNNDAFAYQARLLRLHGLSVDAFDRINKPGQYDIVDLGYKYNCTDIESAVALNSLKYIEDNWLRREEIWKQYQVCFNMFRKEGIFDGEYPENEAIWFKSKDKFADEISVHSLHLFQITLNNRNEFISEMKNRGIFCGIHYNTINSFSYYKKKFNLKMGLFPVAEYFAEHCVSLPLGPGMTNTEVNYVLSCIRELLETKRYLFGTTL